MPTRWREEKPSKKLKWHLGENHHQYKSLQYSNTLNKPVLQTSNDESKDNRNDICFYCQKTGLFKKDCYAFNKLKIGDKKDRRKFKKGRRAMLTEERNKIQSS